MRNELFLLVDGAEEICVGGHTNPDGDAVCACFALALAIEKRDKTPKILLESYHKKYRNRKGADFVYEGDLDSLSPDLFIALDTADRGRLGISEPVFARAKKTVNIDHHISNPNYADVNIVEPDRSSASELVYTLLPEIDFDIAGALYTGILYDTGGLRYPNASPETLVIVSKLISIGIPFPDIYQQTLSVHSVAEARVLALAIDHMTIAGKVSYTYLTIDDMKKAGVDYCDLDGIVEYMLNFENIEAAFFLSERPNGKVKASFRSRTVNVCGVASGFGGGGHKNAAGATLDMDLKAAETAVLSEIMKVL